MTDIKLTVSESTKKDAVKLLKTKENQKILKAGRGKERNSMFTGYNKVIIDFLS